MTSRGDRGRLAHLISEARERRIGQGHLGSVRDVVEEVLEPHHDEIIIAYFSHPVDYDKGVEGWINKPERVITRTFANCPLANGGVAVRARDDYNHTERVVEIDVHRDASYAILGNQEGIYVRQNGGKEVQELLLLKMPED